MSRLPLRALATLTIALSLLVPASSAVAAPSSTALKRAVTVYSKAYLGGDGARAHTLLSRRCRQQISRSEMVLYSSMAADLYGPMPIRTYRARITGKRASVTYTYDVSRLNQVRERWVRESGRWRSNDC